MLLCVIYRKSLPVVYRKHCLIFYLDCGIPLLENMSRIEVQYLSNCEVPLQSILKIFSGKEISPNNRLKSLDGLLVSISLPDLPVFLGVSSGIAVLAYPQLNFRGIGVNVATALTFFVCGVH